MLLSYCGKVPLYASGTAHGHLSHNQASFLPGTYWCLRLGASTEEINAFFISTQVMQENLLTKDTPWGSYSARRFKQKLAQILCIPPAPEEREMLLTVPQCCWCHLSKKTRLNDSDGPPATHAMCFFYLECFVGSIICTWTSCFTDSTSSLLVLFCIRKMSLIKFHFCLMQPESCLYDFFSHSASINT